MSSVFKASSRKRFSIVLATAGVILLAVVFIYGYIRNVLVEQAIDTSTNNLSFVMKVQDAFLGQVNRALENLAVYPGILTPPEAYRRGTQLDNYHQHQYIERIYQESEIYDDIAVYYPREGRVMATRWGVSSIENYKKNMMPAYAGKEDHKEAFFLVTPVEGPNEEAQMALMMNIPTGYIGAPKAVICINISSSYFKGLHNNMDYCGGNYFLMDSEQNLIYCSDALSDDIWSTVSWLQNDPHFLSDGICYEIANVAGRQTLVTIVKSLNHDLVYSHYIPLAEITKEIDHLMSIAIFILLLVALISSLSVFLPMRSVHRAFSRVRKTVSSGEGQAVLPPDMVVERVAHIYKDNKELQSQNSTMQASVNEYKQNQKDQLLYDFLQNVISVQELEDELEHYDDTFFAPHGLFCTVLFSLDNPEHNPMENFRQKRSIYLAHLLDMLTAGFSSGNSQQLTVRIGKSEICTILSMDTDHFKVDSAMIHVLHTLKEVHGRFCAAYGIDVSISISDMVKGTAEIPECYMQSMQVRDGRWLFGYGQVMSYGEVGVSSKQLSYPYPIENNLLDSLMSDNEALADKHLEHFYTTIMDSPGLDIRLIQHGFLQLLSATYRCLYVYYPGCLSSLPHENALTVELLHETTAQRVYARISDIYRQIFVVLGKREDKGQTQNIQAVKEYIDQNYMDPLSPEALGEMFHISVSHLRRLFKGETGVSIKEYTDHVRMEQAIHLLKNTTKSINEIAGRTGFVSQQTFIRVFKKTYRVTPGEYRK